MKLRSTDTFTLPCGCSASDVRFFDDTGEELEDIAEFEMLEDGYVRITERYPVGDKVMTRDRFGLFRARCAHSAPYSNGHHLENVG